MSVKTGAANHWLLPGNPKKTRQYTQGGGEHGALWWDHDRFCSAVFRNCILVGKILLMAQYFEEYLSKYLGGVLDSRASRFSAIAFLTTTIGNLQNCKSL